MDTPELVEIVNPNGRKGHVSASSRAAKAYRRPPSKARPAKNASLQVWVAYATADTTPDHLTPEAADQMTRDELVAHFTSEED